jgi:hypothetical protein
MSSQNRADVAYWYDRVYRPVVDGKLVDHYAVQLRCANRRRNLSVRTTNREKAAQVARDLYAYVSAHGWSALDDYIRSLLPGGSRHGQSAGRAK